uniref:Uncharacterized protein n=1 Tax=Oryctolagus cuniculus TaxID=9986 RepID=A0A5F9C5J4_RABIT
MVWTKDATAPHSLESRPEAGHKENVPPRPAVPLRPEPRRGPRSPGGGLRSGHGWCRPWCQAERQGPAAAASPGTMMGQEPSPVQSNLASARSCLGLALKDTPDPAASASSRQQSNVWARAAWPPAKARDLTVLAQQSNLGLSSTGSPAPLSCSGPHALTWARPPPRRPPARPSPGPRRSQLQATDTLWPGFRPLAGRPRPGPRSWCGLGSWTSGLLGKPLTLEDLAVPAPRQARAPPHAAIPQLLAPVQHPEHQATCLLCPAFHEPPGWELPGHSRPSRPTVACRSHRESENVPDPRAYSKPVWPESALQGLSGVLDSQREVPPTPHLGPGESSRGPPGDPRPPPLRSLAFSGAAGGVGALREQAGGEKARTASCRSGLPDEALVAVRSTTQREAPPTVTPESQAACRQLLSRCFRAWRRAAAAVALGRQQLLQKGLRALRWAVRLREARLEAAGRQHRKALLTRSFREWRTLTPQRPHPGGVRTSGHTQAASALPPLGAGQRRGPSLGRNPGSPREETEAWPIELRPGQRPGDKDGRAQVPQALWRLAVFLLWSHQKQQAIRGEAAQSPRGTGRPPETADAAGGAPAGPQHHRAWLCRCFGAWRRFVQRGAQYRDHLADRRAGTLRTCLGQWVRMKQLRALDGAKLTLLCLCRQKTGNTAFCIAITGASAAQGLGERAQARGLLQGPGPASLQEACRRLALQRALLLWKTRLSQRQQADSFLQGAQQRAMRRILGRWRRRPWGPGTPPGGSTKTSCALKPAASIPGGAALPACGSPCCSLAKASRAPALLEAQVSFRRAAERRQERRCLLLWQVRAQQSRAAAGWSRRGLQRRVLLSWSQWAAAQGAWRELATRQAWDRSCRAVLGLWRQRLAQWREAERRAGQRAWGLARDALRRWHSCWQRQQILHTQYERWARIHLQNLRRAVFQGWRQAAARRRRVQSHFLASCEVARDTRALRAQRGALQDSLRRRTLGAAFATWREAQAAAARGQEQRVAQVSRACQGGLGQWVWTNRQLWGAQTQQALGAWREALGQHQEAQQQAEGRAGARAHVALHWTPWVHEARLAPTSPAPAAQTLSAWVPEALAQSATHSHIQRAATTRFLQAGLGGLLQTHWAQWRTALFRARLERRARAQEAERRLWPGSFPLLLDTPDPWMQTLSSWTPAAGPTVLPGPTHQHSHGGRTPPGKMAWVQICPAFQLWLPWPGDGSSAPGLSPTGPGGPWSPETRALQGEDGNNGRDPRRLRSLDEQAQVRGLKGERTRSADRGQHIQRWRSEALLSQFQASRKARCLAAAWQRWVDVQGAEQLGRTLLRQWHLAWAWRTWRHRVLRLRVARRLRQQEDSGVLSRALEKWHQHLAAGPKGRSPQQPKGPEQNMKLTGSTTVGWMISRPGKMPQGRFRVPLSRQLATVTECDRPGAGLLLSRLPQPLGKPRIPAKTMRPSGSGPSATLLPPLPHSCFPREGSQMPLPTLPRPWDVLLPTGQLSVLKDSNHIRPLPGPSPGLPGWASLLWIPQ